MPPPNSTDFHAAAAAAAQRIFSPSPSYGTEGKNLAEVLADSLTRDVPKIDSAVRAYLSLVAARSLTATKTDGYAADGKCVLPTGGGKDPNMESLKCARALLKAVNSLHLPDCRGDVEEKDEREDDAERLERQVVRIMWNGLASKGHKISKILGRRSLRYAYPYILERVRDRSHGGRESILPVGIDPECCAEFFEEFGSLLYSRNTLRQSDGEIAWEDHNDDDDSALLWDTDRGAAELQRRRIRRTERGKNAAEASEESAHVAFASSGPSLTENDATFGQHGSSVTVEEIDEEETG